MEIEGTGHGKVDWLWYNLAISYKDASDAEVVAEARWRETVWVVAGEPIRRLV